MLLVKFASICSYSLGFGDVPYPVSAFLVSSMDLPVLIGAVTIEINAIPNPLRKFDSHGDDSVNA